VVLSFNSSFTICAGSVVTSLVLSFNYVFSIDLVSSFNSSFTICAGLVITSLTFLTGAFLTFLIIGIYIGILELISGRDSLISAVLVVSILN
jgi:hypothetical protein